MTSENTSPSVSSQTGPNQVDGGFEEDEISLLDLLLVVVDNLRLLVIGPLLIGLGALGFSYTMTPIYTAKTQFLPPQQQSSAASMLASLGALGGLQALRLGLKTLQTSTSLL